MLGLPSVSHPKNPLPGLDLIIGGGYGSTAEEGKGQGDNFEPGNLYLADSDLEKSSIRHGGRYVTSVRQEGKPGAKRLKTGGEAGRGWWSSFAGILRHGQLQRSPAVSDGGRRL